MNKWLELLLLGGLVLLSGCATIVGETDQLVELNSTPDGAVVEIHDENNKSVFKGTTPTTVTLSKKDGFFDGMTYTAAFSKPGYAEHQVVIKPNVSGWYFGNVIFGGLVGILIVDPATGAMFTLNPDQLNPELTRIEAAAVESGSLHVLALDDIPAVLRDDLQPLNI